MSAITEVIKRIEERIKKMDRDNMSEYREGFIDGFFGSVNILKEEAEKEKPLVLCEHCGDMCIEKDV